MADCRQGGAPFIVTLSGLPPFRGVGRYKEHRADVLTNLGNEHEDRDIPMLRITWRSPTNYVKKEKERKGLFAFQGKFEGQSENRNSQQYHQLHYHEYNL